ncbi:toll/interleukin-1 receptor domain-containing protein [Algoriphagus halophytocola]|uniref:Toll/interleukin-1 receptor domain-containing protein n=1 Tax=Algoriphagus halophytocola TaxID=2991499 RepID=A0ABY6MN55_9BACT|nr:MULTISPECIES: toll/interleukin-1 receptor domain-containing protein [unclassified Algoriphagus]UZD24121.1 toll/interleukin-1 receptor domain-containing protein [Algoriphagus sp. TR-M5]WBL41492.1 toll/interleukin-1 receptor domain-containing protein [Algoriphagus sp. TR-M9]
MSNNKIFVSYRRQDASGEAGRLVDHLQEIFGDESVFLDVEAIEAGLDFEQAIDQALNSCKVLLAIIGPHWTRLKDSNGNLRIFEENDFIRLEISAALKRNIRVIPVLVNGADLPSASDLPEDLQGLLRRQTHELSNSRWKYDCDQLSEVLLKVIPPKPKPIPNPKHRPAQTQKKSWLAKNYLWLLGAFVVLLIIIISSDDFQEGFQEGYQEAVNGEPVSEQVIEQPPADISMPVDDLESSSDISVKGSWALYLNGEQVSTLIMSHYPDEIQFLEYNLFDLNIGSGSGEITGNEMYLDYYNSAMDMNGEIHLSTPNNGTTWTGTVTFPANGISNPISLRRD